MILRILKMNMTVGPTQVATVGRLLCLSNLDEQIFTRYVFKNPSGPLHFTQNVCTVQSPAGRSLEEMNLMQNLCDRFSVKFTGFDSHVVWTSIFET